MLQTQISSALQKSFNIMVKKMKSIKNSKSLNKIMERTFYSTWKEHFTFIQVFSDLSIEWSMSFGSQCY